MERGEIWWADLPEPEHSKPGGRRPVVVIQSNAFNRSTIQTVIVVVMTSRLDRADAPGNVLVTAKQSGLRRDSVVNVSQLFTVDRTTLTEKISNMPSRLMQRVDEGLRRVLAV
jgi:mRNA interferase MazF